MTVIANDSSVVAMRRQVDVDQRQMDDIDGGVNNNNELNGVLAVAGCVGILQCVIPVIPEREKTAHLA